MDTWHACPGALTPWVPDTSRWPRESQQGMQHKAARAATTPFFGYSQPGLPLRPARPRRRRSPRPPQRLQIRSPRINPS